MRGHDRKLTDCQRLGELLALLERIPHLPMAERCAAIERLARSSSSWMRERALAMGAALLPDARLVGFLREEADAVIRNIGLEMLKLRGPRAFGLAAALLGDPDTDVVLQAVLALDALRDPRAVEPLRALLGHGDPNVRQATIVALGHLGDGRVVDELMPFLDADPWLAIAALQALGDLHARHAVPRLGRLLADSDLAPLVADALARIGGQGALAELARYFLGRRCEVEAEAMLGLLAHVAEGLTRAPSPQPELRALARAHLDDGSRAARVAAARLFLALGDGEDDIALAVLDSYDDLPRRPPLSLMRRHDLVGKLLRASGALFHWGLWLARRHPSVVLARDVTAVLASPRVFDHLEEVVRLLAHAPVDGATLLAFHESTPAGRRGALLPALARHRASVLAALAGRATPLAVILRAALAPEDREALAGLAELGARSLDEAVDHLQNVPGALRALPWRRLLAAEPEACADAAARAVSNGGLAELGAELRELVRRSPHAAVIRALGEIGDEASVDALAALLEREPGLPRAVALETLGRVGGDAAAVALRRVLDVLPAEERALGHRALARCCSAIDAATFRRAATERDWMLRLAAAEALARLGDPEDLTTLAGLAADPVSVVAERASALLRS